ncbi:MAG: nucleotidyltransferase [Rikenellaceae bacterium]|nr:nucleotidyltransferase [Rikenellaceae bacterium]
MSYIDSHIDSINALCIKYNVNSLHVFGSAVTDRFNEDSDIDFLVVFESPVKYDYFNNYFDFKYALEDLLKRNIDLVEMKSIRNKYFLNEVNATKRKIYGN